MFEIIEKAMLTGIGALSLTQKKAEELIDELQKQFNLSEEKGRELLAKLQETAKESQSRLEELAREEVRKAGDRLGMVTSEEFEKLRKKVHQLEKQLKESGK
jgi:polyhydroxyalkanoate synthesis regulator phasin